jgi:hypothetical protein
MNMIFSLSILWKNKENDSVQEKGGENICTWGKVNDMRMIICILCHKIYSFQCNYHVFSWWPCICLYTHNLYSQCLMYKMSSHISILLLQFVTWSWWYYFFNYPWKLPIKISQRTLSHYQLWQLWPGSTWYFIRNSWSKLHTLSNIVQKNLKMVRVISCSLQDFRRKTEVHFIWKKSVQLTDIRSFHGSDVTTKTGYVKYHFEAKGYVHLKSLRNSARVQYLLHRS